jgi:hypothetical protein
MNVVRWGWLGCVVVMLLVLVGCKTPQPDLKPPPAEEKFTAPPADSRYNTYPKQAFNDDPFKKAAITGTQPVIPTRGSIGQTPSFTGNSNFR